MPTAAGRRKPAAVKYRWRLASTSRQRRVKPDCRVVEHFLHIPPDGDVFRHGKDGVKEEVVGGSGRPVDGALLELLSEDVPRILAVRRLPLQQRFSHREIAAGPHPRRMLNARQRVHERPGSVRILGPSGDRDVPPAGGHGAALILEHRHHSVLEVWVALVQHGPVSAGGLEDGNLAGREALRNRINRDHLVPDEQVLIPPPKKMVGYTNPPPVSSRSGPR